MADVKVQKPAMGVADGRAKKLVAPFAGDVVATRIWDSFSRVLLLEVNSVESPHLLKENQTNNDGLVKATAHNRVVMGPTCPRQDMEP